MPGHQLLGAIVAVGASALYALAVGLQALEARRVPAQHVLRLSLVQRLVRRPLWIAGSVAGAVGWALQGVALSIASLTLVEPVLATSLVFLLVIGAQMLDERVGAREITGTLAIAAGVAGIGLGGPSHTKTHVTGRGAADLARLSGTRRRCSASSESGPVVGCLDRHQRGGRVAVVGLCTKFAADDRASSAWLGVFVWLIVLGVVAGVGVLSEMSALQLRPATQVAPVVFGLQVVIPVVLAPVLAESPGASRPRPRCRLAVSIVAVVAGAAVLSRSEMVGAVLSSDAGGDAPPPLDSAAART